MTWPYNKFKNKRTVVDGITFMSQKEAKRYHELKVLQEAGAIRLLEMQPKFKIEVNGHKVCTYIADFQYYDVGAGHDVVEDVKGVETPIFRLKAKLLKACYPLLDFRIVK